MKAYGQCSGPFPALLALVFAPVLIGCLLAPWVYDLLRRMADIAPTLAAYRFERVATRVVQILALLLAWPCLRGSGVVGRIRAEAAWDRERRGRFLRAFRTGALSIALLYAVGFAFGAYQLKLFHLTPALPAALAGFLATALLVGVLEELFFRGFVQGALRTRLPLPVAALLSAALFAALHFCKPASPEPVPDPAWWSGLALLPHLFAGFRPDREAFYAATLLLMGLALAFDYEGRRKLHGVAGLHAGWVFALLAGEHLCNRIPFQLPILFGRGDHLSHAPAATLAMAAFLLLAIHRHTAPESNKVASAPRSG